MGVFGNTFGDSLGTAANMLSEPVGLWDYEAILTVGEFKEDYGYIPGIFGDIIPHLPIGTNANDHFFLWTFFDTFLTIPGRIDEVKIGETTYTGWTYDNNKGVSFKEFPVNPFSVGENIEVKIKYHWSYEGIMTVGYFTGGYYGYDTGYYRQIGSIFPAYNDICNNNYFISWSGDSIRVSGNIKAIKIGNLIYGEFSLDGCKSIKHFLTNPFGAENSQVQIKVYP